LMFLIVFFNPNSYFKIPLIRSATAFSYGSYCCVVLNIKPLF
jgi:hypothetical protein